jgi:hypothetical protein
MAKTQDLPLNTSEVSGVCGRLLCCLSYENSLYAEARQRMPKINSMIDTPQGLGKIKQLNVLRNSVTVQVEGPGEGIQYVEVPLPEPVLSDAGPDDTCAGCVKRQTALATFEEDADTLMEDEEVSAKTGEELQPEPQEPRQGQSAAPSARQGSRPRSRRKKR